MSSRCLSPIAFLVASLLLHPASFASDWPMHRGNLQRTGLRVEALSLPLNLNFQVSAGASVSSPVKVGGKVFIGTSRNRVVALDAYTGATRWFFTAEAPVDSTPAVEGGILYVASRDGRLYALDAENGSLKWTFERQGTHLSSPLATDGVVYFGTGFPDTSVYALDAASGAVKWAQKLSQPVYSSFALQEGKLLIGANDGVVRILEAASGNVLNTFATGGEIYLAVPAVEEGRFYIAGGQYSKELYAVDLSTGSEIWRHTLGGSDQFIKISSPAVGSDAVYISAGQAVQKLYAIEKATGNLKWQKNLGSFTDVNYLASPVVAGDMVLAGSASGDFYILDAGTGDVLFQYPTGQAIIASPAVGDGMVYVASTNGSLYGFSISDSDLPVAAITSPAGGSRHSKTVEILGTATDTNFQKGVLSYDRVGASCDASKSDKSTYTTEAADTSECDVEIATFYSPVLDGVLATWDTTTVADGDYLLTLDAYDIAGQKASASVALTIDNTPPSLQVTEPAEGLLTNQKDLSVKGSTDGSVVKVGEALVAVDAQGGFSHTLTLSEGAQTITVTAADDLGNERTINRSVTLDTVPPSLQVTEPSEGTITNQKKLSVAGNAEPGASVTVDGQGATLAEDGSFSLEKTLVEGENTIVITAQDLAGNTTTVTRKVTYDPNAPDLTLEAPAEGLVTNQAELVVKGKTEAGALITVNGESVAVAQDGSFSLDLTLAEGENAIEVKATDGAGNQAKLTRIVTLDTQAPQLTLETPQEGLLTNLKELVVSGKAEVGSVLTVAGAPVSLGADGSFATAVTLSEGGNTIEVIAEDRAGNRAAISRSVTLDTVPPELALSEPTDGLITNQLDQTVRGNTEPGVLLTVNGSQVEVAEDGSFAATLSLAEGTNTLEIRAYDPAGNETHKSVTVVVDTMPPALSLEVPFRPWVVNALKISVSLTARDNEGGSGLQVLLLSENESLQPATSCPFEREGEISCPFTLSDKDGAKTLYAQATDRAGNRATARADLHLDRESFVRVPLSEMNGEIVTADGTTVSIPPGALKVKENAENLFVIVSDPLKLGEALPPSDEEVAKALEVAREVRVVDAQGSEVAVSLSAPARIVIPLPASLPASTTLENVRVFGHAGEGWELLTGTQKRIALKHKGAEGVEAQTSRLGLFHLMEVVVGEELITEVFNFPNPFSGTGGTTLNYRLKEDALRVEFSVYTARGDKVAGWRVFGGEKGALIGRNRVKFSGTDTTGRPLPNGVYLYSVKVTGTSGQEGRKLGKLVILR